MHQVGLHWSVSVNLCNDTINALCTNVCNYLQIKNDVENFVYKKIKKIVMRSLKVMRARTRNYYIFLSGLSKDGSDLVRIFIIKHKIEFYEVSIQNKRFLIRSGL